MVFLKFVNTSTTGVMTTFGKFTRTVTPGLKFYIPMIQDITCVSNRTRENKFTFQVKTKDNVFADLGMAVQYRVKAEDTEKAFFSLDDPIAQISSYVENSLRTEAPKITLNQLFESFDDISQAVEKNLNENMSAHGFTLERILMTTIDPAPDVKASIDAISATERLKVAAANEAEADYIKKVKEAEADKQRKILQGEGISGQRQAIIEGYRHNIREMAESTNLSPKDILNFIITSQKLDMQEQIGKTPNTKVMFMDSNVKDTKSDFIGSLESVDK